MKRIYGSSFVYLGINNKNKDKMVIQIRIPQNIINTCKECGWSEEETKEYFSRYMREVMEDPYGQFEQDFENWLQDLDEEEEESDEEYNSLTAKLYCPANNQ